MRTPMNYSRIRFYWVCIAFIFMIFPPFLVGQETELLVSPGKLSKVHGEYSGLDNCAKCHTAGTKSVDGKCLACHEELSRRIDAGSGFHKDKKNGCPKCHPEHQGPEFLLVDWKPSEFNHTKSGYPLAGKHAEVSDCQKCHNARNSPAEKVNGSYLIKSTKCGSCHEDVHRGQFPQDCDKCHTLEVPLKEIKFEHNIATFALKGAHQNVPCEKCHPQKKWNGLKYADCADCHRDPHASSLGKSCTKCHSEVSWKALFYNHGQTKYPLKGKHGSLKCEQCHTGGKMGKVPFAYCRDCHKTDPHQGQFQDDCSRCHNESGFRQAELDHQKTRYSLTGKHTKVACERCHVSKGEKSPVIYKPLKTGCIDCHKDIHLGQLNKDCDQCHSTQGFELGFLNFDHQKNSPYKLEGTHATQKCENCHKREKSLFPSGAGETVRYRPLSSECASCHPDYHDSQLGPRCDRCHSVVHFKPATGFSHEKTSFSITGFHESLSCNRCHPLVKTTVLGRVMDIPRYKPTGTKCVDCHNIFDHSKTAFPLTGRHSEIDCSGCHNPKTPNVKRLRGTAKGKFNCQDCHSYRHPGKQENCADCHSSTSWNVDIY